MKWQIEVACFSQSNFLGRDCLYSKQRVLPGGQRMPGDNECKLFTFMMMHRLP